LETAKIARIAIVGGMSLLYRSTAIAAALSCLLVDAGAAKAETLLDAIDLAYKTNPTLQQQRANLRALDEDYVQALAALRPTLSASAADNFQRQSENTETLRPGAFSTEYQTAGVTLSQPVYTGGAATQAIRAAERDVQQGREQLRAVEAQIMAAVIQRYMDVIRDTEALRINQENVTVLQRQLQETSAQFEVGQLTRTDVAQAEARLAAAQASLSAAQGQLSVSRANYAQVVGQAPGELAAPPALPGVPSTFDAALDVADQANPNLRAARYAEEAARSRVGQARAAYRPTVSVNAGFQWERFPIGSQTIQTQGGPILFTPNPYQRTVTASVGVKVPLFAGGARGSKVRQALQQDNEAVYGVEGERRVMLQAVSQDWAQVTSTHAQTLSNEAQVKAATVAAEGERQEAQVGLRTTIDVLNAEQELRNAQLQLVDSRHDEYVAAAQLLAVMGRLELRDLNPAAPVYDPRRNFDRVRYGGWTPLDPVVRLLDSTAAPGGGHGTPSSPAGEGKPGAPDPGASRG
jgi:outer membrane protein